MTDLLQTVHPSWLPALQPHRELIRSIESHLRSDVAAGLPFSPAAPAVFRALEQPLDSVKVLILGQDPYPTSGHAMGLAFSVQGEMRPLPKSLANIFTELVDDLGVARPQSGDLASWQKQGVLLLNRVLTVQTGIAGSHRGLGWESITDAVIAALVQRGRPFVSILWGKDAQAIEPMLGSFPRIVSAHPSPLSAYRGFFGSKPFSRSNEILVQHGMTPIDWSSVT